jgi:Fe-S-cluster-containing dehydrogenase component
MEKWNLVIDVARCENCNNCVLAAKDEYVGNEFPGYSVPHTSQGAGVFRIERHVRGATPMVDAAYVPVACNHCDDAPCIRAAGDNSIRKRADGIVIIDPTLSRGRRDLVDACPYGAIVWNEQLQLPQQWIFDAHLLDAGAPAPRCVAVCPTGAIEATKIDDGAMQLRARQDGLRVLRPELGTRPRIWYRNLDRVDRDFIGGSVSEARGGVIDCVEGAEVQLEREGAVIATLRTDAFGDFRFDGLERTCSVYRVRVRHAGQEQILRVELTNASVFLGEIRFERGD